MIQRLIYSFLYFIVLVFLLPVEYRKRPKGLRQRWLREKLGNFKFEISNLKFPIIWIHAVSVGEVIAALPLLQKLKQRYPSAGLLISTITDTGQEVAMEKVPEGTQVIYLPFDVKFILRRIFKKIRPSLFITIETELWPNLLLTLKENNIPAVIMNGRISDGSFKGYKKIKFFMKGIIDCIDLFCMQDAVYAERIKELGAPEDKIRVIGSFKFDTVPSSAIPEWTKLLSPPVIIAGSTHRGEEDLIISVYEKLKKDFPELNLIIAPRHPERFGEVEGLIKAKGLAYKRRSELEGKTTPPQSPPWQGGEKGKVSGLVVILDAVGELASTYGASDIAIIGGSFIEHGGQNLLEPAYWAKPIICGPHMENFPFAKEFYEKRAAIETDELNLLERLKELLKSPEKRKAFGERARRIYDEKAGAVDRAMEEIAKFLKEETG